MGDEIKEIGVAVSLILNVIFGAIITFRKMTTTEKKENDKHLRAQQKALDEKKEELFETMKLQVEQFRVDHLEAVKSATLWQYRCEQAEAQMKKLTENR